MNEFLLSDEGYCNGLSASSSQQGDRRHNCPLWFAGTTFWTEEVLLSSSTRGSPGSEIHCCWNLWGPGHTQPWASFLASLYLLISIDENTEIKFYCTSQIKYSDLNISSNFKMNYQQKHLLMSRWQRKGSCTWCCNRSTKLFLYHLMAPDFSFHWLFGRAQMCL